MFTLFYTECRNRSEIPTQRVAKAELNIAQWLSSRNSNYSEDYLRARPAAAAECAEGVYSLL